MNVCFIIPNVFPVPAVKGGACETLTETLIKENEKQGKLNMICVSIYDEEAYEKSKKYKNTKFIYIEKENSASNIDLSFKTVDKSFFKYMDRVYEKIKDIDIDYIVIEGGDLYGYKYLLKRFPKNKCIMHLHGNLIGDKELEETYGYFLAVSKHVVNGLTKGNIIDKNRVKLLYNGIELEKFRRKLDEEEKNEIKAKYNIKENENVVMFCGRTTAQKGIKELILAFKKIRNIENAKLLIVGNSIFGKVAKTEYDLELLQISKEIEDKIVFTGYIHNDELYKIHNISDIAVVPSIAEEAFGLVVVEAMASGLPLIVTRSGGIPEIVNEENAFIIDKDEELIKNITKALDFFMENPEKKIEMGQVGEKLSEKFSSMNFYNEFANIINEL